MYILRLEAPGADSWIEAWGPDRLAKVGYVRALAERMDFDRARIACGDLAARGIKTLIVLDSTLAKCRTKAPARRAGGGATDR